MYQFSNGEAKGWLRWQLIIRTESSGLLIAPVITNHPLYKPICKRSQKQTVSNDNLTPRGLWFTCWSQRPSLQMSFPPGFCPSPPASPVHGLKIPARFLDAGSNSPGAWAVC